MGVGGEAHTTDVFVTVEFGRMHDWTSVTTYSVRTFKTCAYQQISRLETLRIECRSLGKTESEMVKCARQAVKSERTQTRRKLVTLWIPIG